MSSNIDNNRDNDKNVSIGNSINENGDNIKKTSTVVNLKVVEVAEQWDVGRKIARIDPDIA